MYPLDTCGSMWFDTGMTTNKTPITTNKGTPLTCSQVTLATQVMEAIFTSAVHDIQGMTPAAARVTISKAAVYAWSAALVVLDLPNSEDFRVDDFWSPTSKYGGLSAMGAFAWGEHTGEGVYFSVVLPRCQEQQTLGRVSYNWDNTPVKVRANRAVH